VAAVDHNTIGVVRRNAHACQLHGPAHYVQATGRSSLAGAILIGWLRRTTPGLLPSAKLKFAALWSVGC